jgi:hypothetical protein
VSSSGKPNHSRAQYKEAIAALASLMRVTGFRPTVVAAFINLRAALDELDRGNVPDLLQPKSFDCGHPNQHDIWRARASRLRSTRLTMPFALHEKLRRFRHRDKNRILPENYYFPGDLEAKIAAFVEHYNHHRYHESLGNLTPADGYFGRASTILRERERFKRLTIQNRRSQHQLSAA